MSARARSTSPPLGRAGALLVVGAALATGFVGRGVLLPGRDGAAPTARDATSDAVAAPPIGHADPGPSRFEHGVPVGFSRTEDGAVAAAAGYVRTGQAFLDMDGTTLEAAVRTMAATSSAEALLAETLGRLEAARAALAGSDAPIDTTRPSCRSVWMTSDRTTPGCRSGESGSCRGRAWLPRRLAGASRRSISSGSGTTGRC